MGVGTSEEYGRTSVGWYLLVLFAFVINAKSYRLTIWKLPELEVNLQPSCKYFWARESTQNNGYEPQQCCTTTRIKKGSLDVPLYILNAYSIVEKVPCRSSKLKLKAFLVIIYSKIQKVALGFCYLIGLF